MGVDFKWTNTVDKSTGNEGTGSGAVYVTTGTAGYCSGVSFYFSGTGATTLATGTIFWIANAGTGYGQSYVLTSGAALTDSGTGNGTGIPFYPALKTGFEGLTGVLFSASTGYVKNLMFHRDAYKIIMRDPLSSLGGRTMNAEYIKYIDPITGVPLLIGWHPGDLMGLWTVKTLFQWVPWTPEWSCIIAG